MIRKQSLPCSQNCSNFEVQFPNRSSTSKREWAQNLPPSRLRIQTFAQTVRDVTSDFFNSPAGTHALAREILDHDTANGTDDESRTIAKTSALKIFCANKKTLNHHQPSSHLVRFALRFGMKEVRQRIPRNTEANSLRFIFEPPLSSGRRQRDPI